MVLGLVLWQSWGVVLFALSAALIAAGLVRNLVRTQASIDQLFVRVLPGTQLVHVKLYIVDDRVAFTGSANLTYSGMNRNIERMEMKTLAGEVQPEIAAFSGLWGPQAAIPSAVLGPAALSSVQAQSRRPPVSAIAEEIMTREEAATLQRLYKGFQSSQRPQAGEQAPGTVQQAQSKMGPLKTTSTWRDQLLSRMRKIF